MQAVPDRPDKFPPLITRRNGRAARLELGVRRALGRALRPVTWSRPNTIARCCARSCRLTRRYASRMRNFAGSIGRSSGQGRACRTGRIRSRPADATRRRCSAVGTGTAADQPGDRYRQNDVATCEACQPSSRGRCSWRPRSTATNAGSSWSPTAASAFGELGVDDEFVQDNHSRSREGVVRGMHFQPGQAKLVRCVRGAILDVIVDIRRRVAAVRRVGGVPARRRTSTTSCTCPTASRTGSACSRRLADVTYKVSTLLRPRGRERLLLRRSGRGDRLA